MILVRHNGRAFMTRLFAIIILIFSASASSADIYKQVLEGMTSYSITIIGETHKRTESIHFFRTLVSDYVQQNRCLTIALEIASSQQRMIDRIKQGRGGVADIEIAPIIDHQPFRALIDELIGIRNRGNCLKLVAIDAGFEVGTRRDEWMARKLAEQVNQTPLLVLLGSLHTLKKVNWNLYTTTGSPYVAELMASRGHKIRTYPQIWTDRNCKTRSRLISADLPEATKLLNSKLIALLNAAEKKKASEAIDGIILWECG
jgi:uncharacterized iron-regulated protein